MTLNLISLRFVAYENSALIGLTYGQTEIGKEEKREREREKEGGREGGREGEREREKEGESRVG